MRISEQEIRKSLILLAGQPMGTARNPRIDRETSRLVSGGLSEVPDVRMDRVLPLRSAIREHRYHIPGEEVAEKILGRCLADHLR